MTTASMKKTLSLRIRCNSLKSSRPPPFIPSASTRPIFTSPVQSLAQVRSERDLSSDLWFTGSFPRSNADDCGHSAQDLKVDERTLKLGKTLRILQPRLPTLLASPLPPEILSPQIKLHLFPSTHPHLPAVSGRVPYHAALWSAPVAWGRVPLLGNVRLIITSERMVKSASLYNSPSESASNSSQQSTTQNERLIVRWKTCNASFASDSGSGTEATTMYRGIGPREQVNRFRDWLSGNMKNGNEEFSGIFIFEFDEEGRIVGHTIEHAEEGGGAERASRVVNLTDWLIGRARGKERVPELAWIMEGNEKGEPRRR